MRPSLLIPNSTQVPDVILDLWMSQLTEAEFKVVMYVVRHTYGWRKPQDRLSLGQMCEGIRRKDGSVLDTGTGLSRSTAKRAIHSLVLAKVLHREGTQRGDGGDQAPLYGLVIDTPLETLGARLAVARQTRWDPNSEEDAPEGGGFNLNPPPHSEGGGSNLTPGGSDSDPTTPMSQHPSLTAAAAELPVVPPRVRAHEGTAAGPAPAGDLREPKAASVSLPAPAAAALGIKTPEPEPLASETQPVCPPAPAAAAETRERGREPEGRDALEGGLGSGFASIATVAAHITLPQPVAEQGHKHGAASSPGEEPPTSPAPPEPRPVDMARNLLAAAGVDGGAEEELARQHPLDRIQAILRRATREQKGAAWIVKALRQNWNGDPEPEPEPEDEEERRAAASRRETLARIAEFRQIEAERHAQTPEQIQAAAQAELAEFLVLMERCKDEQRRPWIKEKLAALQAAAGIQA